MSPISVCTIHADSCFNSSLFNTMLQVNCPDLNQTGYEPGDVIQSLLVRHV